MNTFERQAMDCGLQQQVPSQIVFDLQVAHPDIAKVLAAATPDLSPVLETLGRTIPLPKTSVMSADRHFYRMTSHNRSFCYALSDSDDIFSSPSVVFKGAEPLLSDFEQFINWMLAAPFRKSTRVMAEHFPLSEGKIPGALSLKEARRESAIAGKLQLDHLRSYGELARLPTPLLVHNVSDQTKEQCLTLLKRKLASAAFDRIEPLLASGLAIYIYHYPVSPVRANVYGSGGSPKLMGYIRKHCAPDLAVSRWMQLLARLLYLGYLPYTPRNHGLGACMDFGNATLDGGFCDPESVEPISSCPDDEFFFESIACSLIQMQLTVGRLASPNCGLEANDLYPNMETFAISRFVLSEFERALDTEARPGLKLDGRVRDIVSPKKFADLARLLERKNRPPNYTVFLRQPAENWR